MFKKIVSNLPFSPALVGQLGFYAKRLRKEKTTRQLALVFVILALIVQSLAIFQPPTSANAASLNDMVNGGIGKSINNFLSPYDSNTRNLKDIMNYVGITRDEIVSSKYTTWTPGSKLSWGLIPYFNYTQGERQINIIDSNKQQTATVYSRPLSLWYEPSTQISGWAGYSSKVGWFAIMQDCGNLVTNNVNIEASTTDIVKSETAVNISQGSTNALKTTAVSGDQISYTISVNNTGLNSTIVKFEDNVSDILDYASLIDNGGGTLNLSTQTLSWPDVILNSKDTQTRTFVIRLSDPIPATAQGLSDLSSYDCTITNVFGNSLSIAVGCPTPKTIESIIKDFPKIGLTENIIFAAITFIFSMYFFLRTRQLEKEVRLIRKNVNIGTI